MAASRKNTRKTNTRKKSSDSSMLDAGGGGYSIIGGMTGRNAPESYSTFSGFTRPDIRGVYGVPNNPPDPIKRPRDRIRVVQIPGPTVYVPVPIKPPKKNKKRRNGGGGGAAGIE